jgi:purine-cytosine permease-like protein
MYVIGMGAAIFTGESDIAQIMVKAGLGVAGLLIIVFSTVTTTFLDAYSAGVSSESLSAKINGKWVALAAAAIGTLGAIFLPLADITDFLYFIGSVFAPMIAIQIADFFILKQNTETSAFNICNLMIWFVGFMVYRLLMRVDIIVGNTLPDMLITIALCVAVSKMRKKDRK